MDKEIETTIKALISRNINAIFAENGDEAKKKILDLIPHDAIVGIGDSATVVQIGVKEEIKRRGTRMLDGFDQDIVYSSLKDYDECHWNMIKESNKKCDVFLTGTNAITQDGRLVNVDGSGNRVSGMFWGPKASVIVIGRNKLVKNLDEAFYRIRNVIAPTHIRIGSVEIGGRRQGNKPCATTGECRDCRTRDRMCNIFTIIEGKPSQIDMTVILVNEDLGLSWDKSWPKERISKIVENYKRFSFFNVRRELLRREVSILSKSQIQK